MTDEVLPKDRLFVHLANIRRDLLARELAHGVAEHDLFLTKPCQRRCGTGNLQHIDNIVEWLRMTDWKKIAEAQNLKIDDAGVAVAMSRLSDLEQQLNALLAALSPDDDPAVMFDASRADQ